MISKLNCYRINAKKTYSVLSYTTGVTNRVHIVLVRDFLFSELPEAVYADAHHDILKIDTDQFHDHFISMSFASDSFGSSFSVKTLDSRLTRLVIAPTCII